MVPSSYHGIVTDNVIFFRYVERDGSLLWHRQRRTSPTSRSSSRTSTSTNVSLENASSSEPQSFRYPAFSRVVILIGLFCLVADLGGSLINTPEVRLLEMSVCRDYYYTHDPSVIGSPPLAYLPEQLCKIRAIQGELAHLTTAKSLLMNLPGTVALF